MQLFYCPEFTGNLAELPEEEAHHIFHVLRSKPGELIQLTNGKGKLLTARLTEVSKKKVAAEITEEISFTPRVSSLHIAIAPTKNIDRFEWFLEKATEIGIEKITPLLCRHSERKEIKNERLEKVIIAAAKQSRKAFFPVLNPMINFEKFLDSNQEKIKLIAHCSDDENKISLQKSLCPSVNALILIGPEGDFSPEEIRLALESGYRTLTLGENRLRTETAGVFASAAFALFNT